jgi:hypothetical protein
MDPLAHVVFRDHKLQKSNVHRQSRACTLTPSSTAVKGNAVDNILPVGQYILCSVKETLGDRDWAFPG